LVNLAAISTFDHLPAMGLTAGFHQKLCALVSGFCMDEPSSLITHCALSVVLPGCGGP